MINIKNKHNLIKFVWKSNLNVSKKELMEYIEKTDKQVVDYINLNILRDKSNLIDIIKEFSSIEKINETRKNTEIDIIRIRQFNEIIDIVRSININTMSNISMESNLRLLLERYLIFKNLSTDNLDENIFKFHIYKIAGFQNRYINKYKNSSNIHLFLKEMEKQKKEINKSYNEIKKTKTYNNLTGNSKLYICDKRIGKGDFKPTITNNNNCYWSTSWENLMKLYYNSKIRDLYPYLSYKVHPSYLNYYQYNNNNLNITLFNFITALSVYYYDFLTFYPNIKIPFKYTNELELYKLP